MGYAQSKRIRIYGQEFEAVPTRFPMGLALPFERFLSGNHGSHLTVPLPVVQMVTRQKRKKVA